MQLPFLIYNNKYNKNMKNNLTELPNRWQIKVTKENQNMVKDFFIKQTQRYRPIPVENPTSPWFFSIGYIYGFKDDYYFNGDKDRKSVV